MEIHIPVVLLKTLDILCGAWNNKCRSLLHRTLAQAALMDNLTSNSYVNNKT